MKLQAKVVLILAFIWAVIFLVMYIDSREIVARNYKQLENKLISMEIRDTIRIFERTKSTLNLYTIAWADWDDAYKFMKNKNAAFIKSNFVPGTYTSSDINFFIFYDNKGKLFYGKKYDPKTGNLSDIPKSLENYLDHHPEFVLHSDVNSQRTGVINTPAGLILMSSLPVLTSNNKGPVQGTLLIGYYLSNRCFANLADTVGLPIQFYKLPIQPGNSEIARAYQKLISGNHCVALGNIACHISIRNKNTADGFVFLKDINNIPVGILRIEIPRVVYEEGVSTAHHYLLIVLAIGFFVIFLTWYLLKIFVLDRIIHVSNQVLKISKEGKFNQTLQFSGTDELSAMVLSINHMMALIAETQRKLNHSASHDTLTTLPNRTLFFDLITQALAEANKQKSSLAVMFLDMDKFKEVNDKHGHIVGDKVLNTIGKRLSSFMDAEHIIARQSGDEFILFVKNAADDEAITRFAEEILKEVTEAIKIGNIAINPIFSIGISLYPSDGISADELLRKADQAMYVAKNNSGNSYQYYSNIDLSVI